MTKKPFTLKREHTGPPAPDLDRPRDRKSLFGYGAGGVPSEIDSLLSQDGMPEQIAEEIIARWKAWADSKQHRGRRRIADSQLPELATAVYVLIAWFRKRNVQVPEIVMEALACTLGLLGSKAPNPLPNWTLLREMGADIRIPDDVTKRTEWLAASAARGQSIAEGKKPNKTTEAEIAGVSRDRIRVWEKSPEYQKRAQAVAALSSATKDIYRRWNATPRRRPEPEPED